MPRHIVWLLGNLYLKILALLFVQTQIFPANAVLVGKNPGDNDLCKSVSVTVSYTLKSDCSFTTYCYTITTCTRGVDGWEITGKSPFLARLSSAFGDGIAKPGVVTSSEKISSRVERMSQCFTVPKKSNPTFGNIRVFLEGGVECYDSIKVPLASVECKCIVDKDPARIKKGSCDAKCRPQVSTAVGTQTNTWAINKPGGDCTSTFAEPCTINCPVDCVLDLEPPKVCDVACNLPQKVHTRYWTTSLPMKNGGQQCHEKNPNYELQYCNPNPCPIDCVLNKNRCTGSSSEECVAECKVGNAQATGQKPCTYETLVTPLYGGKQCTDTTTLKECKKNCPVDCELKVPNPENVPCPADCMKKTATKTILATIVKNAENGGKACPNDLVFGREVCTMPQELFDQRCSDVCVVDGIPENPCLAKCNAANPPSGNFWAYAQYPVTLQYPPNPEQNCPFYKTLCNCDNCILHPVPTEIGQCNAKCIIYDDSYAYGARTLRFSTVREAKANGACSTLSVENCSTKCKCTAESYINGVCIPTKTVTLKKPWIGLGLADATPVAALQKCATITKKTCSTILTPKNCRYVSSCNACGCTSTEGPNYQIQDRLLCTNTIQAEPLYGGAPCPSTTSYSTCAQKCVGCVYTNEPICRCMYTESLAQQDATTYSGYSSCSYPLVTLLPQIKEDNLQEQAKTLCTQKTSQYFGRQCTSTLSMNDCERTTKSCDRCTVTSTIKNGDQFTGLGFQTCLLNDFRGLDAPAACTKSMKSRTCSVQLFPTDCQVIQACAPCSVKCNPGDTGVLTATATCVYKTVQTPSNGGAPCPIANLPAPKCNKNCDLADQGSDTPIPFKDPFLNGFFTGQFTGLASSVAGRLVVCDKTTLLDFSVGAALESKSSSCDIMLPALYVASDLMMLGRIFGGSVSVKGLCSDSISSNCGIKCANCNEDNGDNYANCWQQQIDCEAAVSYVTKLTLFYTNRASNVIWEQKADNLIHLTWKKGAAVQMLYLTPEQSNPVLPWANYIGELPDSTEIAFIILGSKISISRFSLKYFEKRARYVYWVFPSAKEIYLNEITIHGSFIAPRATIYGKATINGVVFAKSHVGGYDSSLRLTLPDV